MEILLAKTPEQVDQVRELFEEYYHWLIAEHKIDIGYQGVQAELVSLPGAYSPPGGCLLLALEEGHPAGSVGIRPTAETGICELKRTYVQPDYRGRGIGKALGLRALAEARRMGYRRIRLDTATFLQEAQQLYLSLGFQPIQPYNVHPDDIQPMILYMEMSLD
jgi:GNAT superfamily N-acetyltransferase